MPSQWLEYLFDKLLKKNIQDSPLNALGTYAPYMLFVRKGDAFRVAYRGAYADMSFFYSFLDDRPEILAPLLQEGHLRLPSEEASQVGCSLWAAVDRLDQPEHLLIAELPPEIDFGGHFLRMLLTFELVFRRGLRFSQETEVDLPVWLEGILPKFLEKNSPILIIAEAGSGKEELVQAFLKEKYGSMNTAVFFHPGRLSQAVQLRELFGDPAGVRLGGASPSIPVVERKEPVAVIQEAGDLDRLAQLRLLALFSSSREKKLWIFETCRDLKQMAEADQFLPGLNELLLKNAVTLFPLRHCLDQLPREVDRLMNAFREHYRRKVVLEPQAQAALSEYHWPGNWRELKNTLESAFLMTSGNAIQEKDLRLGRWAIPEDWDDLNLRKHSEAMEKMLLLRAYALHAGNQVQMARALGISRGSLQYKLEKYKLN